MFDSHDSDSDVCKWHATSVILLKYLNGIQIGYLGYLVMQPGRAPSAPCFGANVRNVYRINKKVLISNRQQKINGQNLNVIIKLSFISDIDRAEIVFHHLCFLLMYVQYHRRLYSMHPYLIVSYWDMRLDISSLVRAYKDFIRKMFQSHPVGRDIWYVNFTLRWGLLTIIYFEKCQWPLVMPALPRWGKTLILH